MQIKHDGELQISVVTSRTDKKVKSKRLLYSELLAKLAKPVRTDELYEKYLKLPKDKQDAIKDVGGFIGGEFSGSTRKKGTLLHRSVLTLDIDDAPNAFWGLFQLQYPEVAACIYSTHKHGPNKARYRLVMPLNREVDGEEYQAVGRKVAEALELGNMAGFDRTTFQPTRLMYWPSAAKDGVYEFRYQDEPWLDVDAVLSEYDDWRDHAQWPYLDDKEDKKVRRAINRRGDPRNAPGAIGAFNRVYNIHEAIEEFLNDVYEPGFVEDRYTYTEGSTANGLVVYDEGNYAFSNHNTDPAGGKLCNAFDLVRLHKFGDSDINSGEDTPVNRLPSHLKMVDFAQGLEKVNIEIARHKRAEVFDDFADDEIDLDWTAKIVRDSKGNVEANAQNFYLIVENELRGALVYDDFAQRRIVKQRLPWDRKGVQLPRGWTDTDDAGLRSYIEKAHGVTGGNKVEDALKLVFLHNAYHPVRDYLKGLQWDGVERVDELLIKVFSAEDNAYTRQVMRKALVACVKRVYEPGCKFDHVLTLVGPQGARKSTFLRLLGKDWYTDSFSTVIGKEAIESILGKWVVEIAELNALKRAEVEAVKHFITKQYDHVRLAYARNAEDYQRQCVFFATTNTDTFLQDATGNRRWWPVTVHHGDLSELNEEYVNQVWAEALHLYKTGEPTYLTDELEALARMYQAQHTEVDERQSIIERYLDIPIPDEYYTWSIYQRRSYLNGEDEITIPHRGKLREAVTVLEIWTEALGLSEKDLNKYATRPINDIMKNIPGWEKVSSMRKPGDWTKIQRGYRRVKTHDYSFLN